MNITWHAERRPLAQITEHPNNPRQATEREVADLRKSIDRFGLAEPLVLNQNGSLIGGHARLKILREKGETETDVWLPDRILTQPEIDELLLRLNKNTMSWSNEALANFSEETMLAAGFTESELEFRLGTGVPKFRRLTFNVSQEDYDKIGKILDKEIESGKLENRTAALLSIMENGTMGK